MREVRIGNIVAKEGEKTHGFLDVGTTSTTTHRIPLVIFNGMKTGPTLAVYGGIHGLEYASIEAVQRLIKKIDPKKLSGVLLAVPVVNQANFDARKGSESPIDGINLNRTFPGKAEGTMSYRVAHTLFKEIASKADAQIDCHGGDLMEDIGPGKVSASHFGPKEVDEMAIKMASCYAPTHITLRSIDRGMSLTVAKELKIPAIMPEAGTPYPVRESQVLFHYDGIINVMKMMKMLEGEPRMTKPPIDPPRAVLTAKRGGIFHSFVDIGEEVKASQAVAEVTNVFGEVLDTYESPIDGMVTERRVHYAVNCGELLFEITQT